MIRLVILGALGFVAYKVVREMKVSIPGDFEPVGLLPPPSDDRLRSGSLL